jgi:hypothetical protein
MCAGTIFCLVCLDWGWLLKRSMFQRFGSVGRSQDGNTFGSGKVWNFADEFQDEEANRKSGTIGQADTREECEKLLEFDRGGINRSEGRRFAVDRQNCRSDIARRGAIQIGLVGIALAVIYDHQTRAFGVIEGKGEAEGQNRKIRISSR